MEAMHFYDINKTDIPILMVRADYGLRPSVGDCIIVNGYKYKVVEICIDYYGGNFTVFLDKQQN